MGEHHNYKWNQLKHNILNILKAEKLQCGRY